MVWEANRRYQKAYRDADTIINENKWEKGLMSNGEFAQRVMSELVRLELGDDWDNAVEKGVIDRAHGRPMSV